MAAAAPSVVGFCARKHLNSRLLYKNLNVMDERDGARKAQCRLTDIAAGGAASVVGFDSSKHLSYRCLCKNVNAMDERERSEESASAQ
jgi:hypothetical protein